MGTTYRFFCNACSYERNVCGRQDSGERYAMATIACTECRELYDVVTHWSKSAGESLREREAFAKEHPEVGLRDARPVISEFWEAEIVCPKSYKHRWRLWEHPDDCPRCGARMIQGRAMGGWK
jgi:hypothetical protein